MSREILFRGKRTYNKKWIEGSLVVDYAGNTYIVWEYETVKGAMISSKTINIYPETVGEYTGLTDKNGKRIFEGDIVICKKEICGNFIDSCVEIGFVEMKHGAFGLHRKQGYYRPFKDWLEDYEYEIIGNIHDNPELLEVSE